MADEPETATTGGRILGLRPRTALITAGLALGGALAYMWWRNRQASAAASTAATSTTGCTDANGNAVPCPDSSGVDYSGELSVIQTELESLLASQAGDTDTDTDTQGANGANPPHVPPGSPKPKRKGHAPSTPAGVTISGVTATGCHARWQRVQGATGYAYRITYQEPRSGKTGVVKASPTTRATSVSISGLQPDRTYTLHVKACSSEGCSPETNGPAIHTKAR